ncbi:uncharacterized protein VICG_01190 [Vittaforma corneae ATCC 50505]|uniref:Uncharacterized protein n=1 Tax=Vittaforma corneae (strain ATCC 50505) TaxID=993615 RepID=L2GLS2_VITCO|nr:uncharacterized protein VICG_01190 [Vittaforma corneae ATCC 50505]ELA41838.1 hypothetical protein VICG_01190 [Vittaforma corneae ATCC 50505]
MEKLRFDAEVENEMIETAFRERAMEKLLQMNVPPFTAVDMELARSEKEISKCLSILEREQKTRELVQSKREQRKKKHTKKNQKKVEDKENYKSVFKKIHKKFHKKK